MRSVFKMTTKKFLNNKIYTVPKDCWTELVSNWKSGADACLKGHNLKFDISKEEIEVGGKILKTLDDLVGPHHGELLLIRSNVLPW